ncbi:MAG: sulfotransferase [Methylococcaceae bacterium]|nr:sulfotransferase [Methylococcaceae bacterium]
MIDDRLLFLISQPRAGSTMTQKILGCNPDVHTLSEPWLMLHPLYALKASGHTAEYNAAIAAAALRDFLSACDLDEQAYYGLLGETYGKLYQSALDQAGKRYFLDKTPRYYLIIPELAQTFPAAQFIILLRNPLAVLCSLCSSYVKGNWGGIAEYQPDILDAPRLLLEGVQSLGKRAIVIRYEAILANPEQRIRELCDRLGLAYRDEMIVYGAGSSAQWRLGDKKQVNVTDRPNRDNADAWIGQLADPQTWRVCSDYLEILGPATVESLGYSYPDLRNTLDGRAPTGLRLWRTKPLSALLGNRD